ncbi:glycosyltransferase [Adhaeribacter radiodurans]|uniref:Glycosyltransferase n=1 Tax=Adhaeribacter radiodurans TaxID=2745197 RepID=A0A7L7L3T5_9BACT|nr:glycosyltransferase [Adhaeribacter radiodurans]QMU27433.1 glycosyltransferase [Adhaeribacter radiodurans]
MKLLHVIGSMNPIMGGVCQAVRTMIAGLEEFGIHNEVTSLDAPDSRFSTEDSFQIHALGPGKSSWGYSPLLFSWLTENLVRFDVVICHGLWLYPGFALTKALYISNKRHFIGKQEINNLPKLFIMPHGMLDPYFQKAPGRKLKALRNWAYWKLIEGRNVNEADGILYTCREEHVLAAQSFRPYSPKREIIVGLGVEEPPPYTTLMQDAFLEKCPEVKDSPYILFISRIHEKKGINLLLNAFKILVNKRSEDENESTCVKLLTSEMIQKKSIYTKIPKLIIAGPGLETTYGKYLQQIVSESPELHDLVFFPGMLLGNEKWGAFYGSEAFILPSHQENFGIAVVEALACSKPVLISNQVNIWREIQSSGGGIIGDNSIKGTSKLLESWLLLSFEERQRMARSARRCFNTHFSIYQATVKLLNALKN